VSQVLTQTSNQRYSVNYLHRQMMTISRMISSSNSTTPPATIPIVTSATHPYIITVNHLKTTKGRIVEKKSSSLQA